MSDKKESRKALTKQEIIQKLSELQDEIEYKLATITHRMELAEFKIEEAICLIAYMEN